MWLRISCLLVDMLVETWSTAGKLLTDSLCCSIRSCLLQVVLVDSIDRYSVDMLAKYWPCIGQVSTDTWPIFWLTVSWMSIEYWSSVSWVKVMCRSKQWADRYVCQSSVGWVMVNVSTDTWLTFHRYLNYTQPTLDWLSANISAVYWLSVDRYLVMYLWSVGLYKDYWSILSADSTYTKHDPFHLLWSTTIVDKNTNNQHLANTLEMLGQYLFMIFLVNYSTFHIFSHLHYCKHTELHEFLYQVSFTLSKN